MNRIKRLWWRLFHPSFANLDDYSRRKRFTVDSIQPPSDLDAPAIRAAIEELNKSQ